MRMEDLGRITGLRNEIRSIEEQIKDLEKWGTIPSAQNPFDVLSNGASIRVPGNPTEAWVNRMWQLRTRLLEKRKCYWKRLYALSSGLMKWMIAR